MIDIGQPLRKAYYDVLKNNITVEGAIVPIVDEKLDVDINTADIYVLMTSQDETAVSNKSMEVNETLLTMQIVNQRRATNTKEVVESVAGQILQLLFPSRLDCSIALADPLSLTYARFVSGQYNPLVQDTNGFLISKVLIFKNRITQN